MAGGSKTFKMFGLERLYSLSPVEVSKTQTNIGLEMFFGNYGSGESFARKKVFGFAKNLGLKKFLVRNIWAKKNLGSRKNFRPEKFGSVNNVHKQFWVKTTFWVQNFFGPKNFGHYINDGFEKCWSKKNEGLQKMWSKNFGQNWALTADLLLIWTKIAGTYVGICSRQI